VFFFFGGGGVADGAAALPAPKLLHIRVKTFKQGK